MAEQEGIQRGGVTADHVFKQVLDLLGGSSNVPDFGCCRGFAELVEDAFGFLKGNVLVHQQAVEHGDASTKVKDVLFQLFKSLFCTTQGFLRLAELMETEVNLHLAEVHFGLGKGRVFTLGGLTSDSLKGLRGFTNALLSLRTFLSHHVGQSIVIRHRCPPPRHLNQTPVHRLGRVHPRRRFQRRMPPWRPRRRVLRRRLQEHAHREWPRNRGLRRPNR